MSKKKKKTPAAPKTKLIAVKLTRLASNNAALRTPSVVGFTNDLPQVGKSFILIGESLTPENSARLIQTTAVTTCSDGSFGDTFRFTTQNSEYFLEVLADEQNEEEE